MAEVVYFASITPAGLKSSKRTSDLREALRSAQTCSASLRGKFLCWRKSSVDCMGDMPSSPVGGQDVD